MAVVPIQATFGRGELSPRLRARIDIAHWAMGLQECFNFIVLRQGGLTRRPGTIFIGEAKTQDMTDPIVLFPFEGGGDQSYVLEMGEAYARFWTLNGRVETGGNAYEIATPWAASALPLLQQASSGDVAYIVHAEHEPHKLSRFSELDWTIEPAPLEDGPYGKINDTAVTLTPNGSGDLTPRMTSDTAPSGAAASLSNGVGSSAYMAFDGSSNAWIAGAAGYTWIQYTFPSAKVVDGYVVAASVQGIVDNASLRAPRNWTLSGSPDGTTWTLLHNVSGETDWGGRERRYFTFTNETPFTIYRFEIFNNNSSDATPLATAIGEISFKGGGPDEQEATILASDISAINNGQGFLPSDVGRHIRILSEDAYWHWFEITGVLSTTLVDVAFKSPPLPSTSRFMNWRLGAFSESSGFPSAVAFFGERLTYGGTASQPMTVWGSVTGDIDNFGTSIPAVPDDAFTFTVTDAGRIRFLADVGDLLIGTTRALRTLAAADKNEGFSGTNLKQGQPYRPGFDAIQPEPAGSSFLAIGAKGKTLREIVYSLDANGQIAPDIGVLSEHVFKAGVKWHAYAASPNAIHWMGLNDGTMAAVTYEKEQQMIAVHRHEIAGGSVEWGTVIPAADRDELWLVVKRTINGVEKRYIEKLAPDFDNPDDVEDAVYLDCSVTVAGPATTVTGLAHLEGETVVALADGGAEGGMIVTGGEITLPSGQAATTITVGLSYESRAKTLPISQGARDGTALGRRKKIIKLIAHLKDTLGFRARGAGKYETPAALVRQPSTPLGEADPLYTGPAEVRFDDRWEGQGVTQMICDGPHPATILAVSPVFEGEP